MPPARKRRLPSASPSLGGETDEGEAQGDVGEAGIASPFAQHVHQRLEDMRHLSAADGASIFHELVVSVDARATAVGSWRKLLWEYAQAFDYHQHLDFQSYDEMQTKLDGISLDSGSKRSIQILQGIRKSWGTDFHLHIPQWPVPAGEKLLAIVYRASRTTSVAVFASRIIPIIAGRVRTKNRRGVRHDTVLRVSDMLAYGRQYSEEWADRARKGRPLPEVPASDGGREDTARVEDSPELAESLADMADDTAKTASQPKRDHARKRRRRPPVIPSYGEDSKEDRKGGAATVEAAEDADTMEDLEDTAGDVAGWALENRPSPYMAPSPVMAPATPRGARGVYGASDSGRTPNQEHSLPTERGRGGSRVPTDEYPDSPSPLSYLAGTGDHRQSLELGPRASFVNLGELPDPGLTDDHLHTSLRGAIQNLSSSDRLNDEAINFCLQWEALRTRPLGRVALKSSFFLDLSGAREAGRPSRRSPAQRLEGRLLIPLHHPDEEHWTLVLIDFGALAVDVYDARREASRFSTVAKRVLEWIARVDKSIDVQQVNCRSKVCPQQSDSVSCGLYVLEFGAALLRGKSIPATVNPQAVRAFYRGALTTALETLSQATPPAPHAQTPTAASIDGFDQTLTPRRRGSSITNNLLDNARALREDYSRKVSTTEKAICTSLELSVARRTDWARELETVAAQVRRETAIPTLDWMESVTTSLSDMAAAARDYKGTEQRLKEILERQKARKLHYDALVTSVELISAGVAEEDEDAMVLVQMARSNL